MDLEKAAFQILELGESMSKRYYNKPLVITYSGGKDSDVLLELAKRSGIEFEVHNSHTTVDAPPTVYHIRKKFRELELKGIKCEIEMPTYKGQPTNMWKLISQKLMPPSRYMRYCCSVLKETGCPNRVISTGVRKDESRSRSERTEIEAYATKKENSIRTNSEVMLMNDNTESRKVIEHCQLKGKIVVNPIIDWSHRDIWEYIRSEHIEYNPLYNNGYDRVGCIGCPLANKRSRQSEFNDFPQYKKLYINAFDKMLENRLAAGKTTTWKSGIEVFKHWMEDDNVQGQLGFDLDGNISEDYT